MKNITKICLVYFTSLTISCDMVKEQYNTMKTKVSEFSEVKTTQGAMILDITDMGLANISSETAYDYWNSTISENGSVHLSVISRKRTNKEAFAQKKALSLLEKAMWTKNELEAHELKFEKQFKGGYERLNTPIPNCRESYVFSTINEELHRLVSLDGDEKILVCLTDGIENGKSYSFYWDKRRPQALVDNHEKILKKLEKAYGKLPEDLRGTEIVFVHEPQYKLDKLFSATKEWWQIVLEEKGAKVKFQTFLN